MKVRALLLIVPLVVTALPVAGKETLAQQEARLLSQVRGGQGSLVQLAAVREQRGRYREALATWALVKKQDPKGQVTHDTSAPESTYADLADFVTQRLHRKQNLAASPPRFDQRVHQQAGEWLQKNWFFALQSDGNYELLVQADLDGDFIDEVFFVGKHGPLTRRDKPFMGIAKWDGKRYKVIYRATGKQKPIIMPVSYAVVDRDGDGWKEIRLVFEPETENMATLYFNGTEAIMY